MRMNAWDSYVISFVDAASYTLTVDDDPIYHHNGDHLLSYILLNWS
jgi:hypothetical protein